MILFLLLMIIIGAIAFLLLCGGATIGFVLVDIIVCCGFIWCIIKMIAGLW